MKQHLLPISILLEAKMIYFGAAPKRSRHRENVLERQAFTNAFIKRAKTVDVAAVLNKHHASIIHYRKNHDSDLKCSAEYREAYRRALAVYEQYDPKIEEDEFAGMDNARLLALLKEFKNKVDRQEKIIDDQRKEIQGLKIAVRELTN